jgi:galactose mutarotase-like enzyme
LKHIIKNNFVTATFNSKGAELISLKSSKTEYIWNGNPKFWGKHSPVLFPIVGTLKNNSYMYGNKTYSLSRHGFARDLEFDIIESNQESIVFSLKSNLETQKMYPFDFELRLKYALENLKLIISYEIINNSVTKMPFSIGAHPAFSLQNDFENYSLKFNENENLLSYTLENDLISETTFNIETFDKKLPLTYSLFENDALIFKKLNSKSITIFENKKPLIKVEFNDFPFLGIWTKPNAKFICIEPWLGYSDTNNCSGKIIEKEGIEFAIKNKPFCCSFTIEIL